ncbi:MAG: hypothetical protein VB081_01100 [Christensenella sp.]|uniref:hypothetical protein n=1 Tax=Christensenella sp. TaxID=1935934 RepID=UPI002B219FCA|nr:hypothetical protein [Christensenella sp.]MEA5002086.1 hypothetical protein [Christensenella sp.]
MRKIVSFVTLLLVFSAFVMTACSAPPSTVPATEAAAAPSESAASPSPSASSAKSTSAQIDDSLLLDPWKLEDFSDVADMRNYLFYYSNPENKNAYIIMTQADHYEDRSDDLTQELKRNVDTYINQTLKGSMKESSATQPVYYEIDGYPAASFDVTGTLQDGSEAFTARTVFVATDKKIYCLQLQDSTEHFDQSSSLFDQVKDSLTIA